MKVLSLSTYPIRARLHGGQRRISAFGDFYRSLGASFHYAAAYIKVAHHHEPADPDDFAVRAPTPRWDGVPFVADIAVGEAAAEQPDAYRHFKTLFERIQPDLIQLDQPFMWPVVERARREGALRSTPMIYSSQNWEGPLKSRMLHDYVGPRRAGEIGSLVEALELEVSRQAIAVVAVGQSDAEIYRRLKLDVPVFTVLNGVDRPPSDSQPPPAFLAPFKDNPYFYFVGSAYPPNSEGFCRLILRQGLFFHRPSPFIAMCGGASREIVRAHAYQRLLGAHEARIRVFPNLSDHDLWAVKRNAHAALLPIDFGGGSNLKTAEALASGKWIVATSTALRGFEPFHDAPGIVRADSAAAFHDAMAEVIRRPPLTLSSEERQKREGVFWDRCFSDSAFKPFIAEFMAAAAGAEKRAVGA